MPLQFRCPFNTEAIIKRTLPMPCQGHSIIPSPLRERVRVRVKFPASAALRTAEDSKSCKSQNQTNHSSDNNRMTLHALQDDCKVPVAPQIPSPLRERVRVRVKFPASAALRTAEDSKSCKSQNQTNHSSDNNQKALHALQSQLTQFPAREYNGASHSWRTGSGLRNWRGPQRAQNPVIKRELE